MQQKSCRDPYYIQIVFEYLLHLELHDTARLFKQECGIKMYSTPHTVKTVRKVPDIVLYLPPKESYEENWSSQGDRKVISKNVSCCKDLNQDKHSDEQTENNYNTKEGIHSHSSTLFTRRQNQGGQKLFNPNPVNEVEECQLNYSQLKHKFSQLHSDYHNLIGVASELTAALEKTARGQEIDLRDTLDNCLLIFPGLFSQKRIQNKHKSIAIKGRFSVKSDSYGWDIDVVHIKRHLVEENVKTRLLLLQALRWAITRTSSEKREYIMSQYVCYDVLNLQGENLLEMLLIPSGVVTPHPLQQSAARFLNTLASIQSGRSYLAQNSQTVTVTASVLRQLNGVSIDLITKNMLIAALQKLSLRRNQRIAMIQSGMVEWLFQNLLKLTAESTYSLEYGTALLMNLCLHRSAKDLCIPIAHSVMTVLITLLSSPVTQALPYVNGILYSLLSHPALNDEARKSGVADALLQNCERQQNLEIRKQMEHISEYHKGLLHSGKVPLPISEGEMIDEDDEELDLLGEELDENDPVRNMNGELNGEDLLRARYTLQNNGSSGETTAVSETESRSPPLALRPTTPHYGPPKISNYVDEEQNDPARTENHFSTKNNWLRRKASLQEEKPGTGETSHKDQLRIQYQTLPQISIHLVSPSESGDTDNLEDADEDSNDVQVATMSSKPYQSCNIGQSSLDKGTDLSEQSSHSSGPDACDSSAFTSRPKIPRTPPHQD